MDGEYVMHVDPADLWHADQNMAELDAATNQVLNEINHARVMGEADEVHLTFAIIGLLEEEFELVPEAMRYNALLTAHARALVRWSK